MAFTVTDHRTILSTEDNLASQWEEGTTSDYTTIDDGGLEGVGFVAYDVDIETLHNFDVVTVIPLDMTGFSYGRWLKVTNAGALDTKINGGMRLCLRDGAGNESYWFVGGVDTYSGGWVYFVASFDRPPDANNGTDAVLTNAVNLGVGFKLLAKSLNDNCQMDLAHYGNDTSFGISITGTPDTVAYGVGNSLEEVVDIVIANFYGVLGRQVSSYVAKSIIQLGGDASLVFNDSDSILFFADMPVNDSLYRLVINSTNPADITLIGLTTNTAGDTAAELNFNAPVTSFVYDSSTALKQGLTTFKTGDYEGDKFVQCAGIVANAGANLNNFVSDKSGLITLNTTAILTNSTITESTGGISVICEDLARVNGTVFTSDGDNHAVELTGAAGSYTWGATLSAYDTGIVGNGVQITGGAITGNEAIHITATSGTFDISVSDTGTVPSVSTAGAIVNVIAGQATLKITVLDENKNPIENAQTSIGLLDAPFTQLMNEDTLATGVAEEQYSFGGIVDIVYKVRKSESTDDPRYFPVSEIAKITADGLNITVTLKINNFL